MRREGRRWGEASLEKEAIGKTLGGRNIAAILGFLRWLFERGTWKCEAAKHSPSDIWEVGSSASRHQVNIILLESDNYAFSCDYNIITSQTSSAVHQLTLTRKLTIQHLVK
jgi:hypothetical protein